MIISFVTAKKYSMKLGVLLVILAVGIMPISAYAQTNEFGFKLFPEKILEYTDGTLQIFVESNGLMIPREIIGLKTSSSDSSVIKIIGLEPANEFITNIKIQAQQPGQAKISLAAPGFSSQEILIKVYDNNNYPIETSADPTPPDEAAAAVERESADSPAAPTGSFY